MSEDEDRCVERWVGTPPALPLRVLVPSGIAELPGTHDLGADPRAVQPREGAEHRDCDRRAVASAPAAEQVHAPDREERHVDDGAEEIEDAEDRAVPSVGRTCRERARRHGEQGGGDAPRQLVAPPPRQPALERRQAEGERH